MRVSVSKDEAFEQCSHAFHTMVSFPARYILQPPLCLPDTVVIRPRQIKHPRLYLARSVVNQLHKPTIQVYSS